MAVRRASLLRWTASIAAFAIVACVSFFVGALYGALDRPGRPRVPLTADLPNSWEQASQTFDARIKSSFLIGSPVAEMAKTLQSQGFVRGDWSDLAEDEHHAFRDENTFVCNIAAIVFWKHDAAGRLTWVSGTYGQQGCL